MLHPYFIYYAAGETEGQQDEDGNFIPAETRWKYYGRGRDDENPKGNVVQLADGASYQYSAVVYAERNKKVIPEGTFILVLDKKIPATEITAELISEGQKTGLVRQFKAASGYSLTQLNTRIWL